MCKTDQTSEVAADLRGTKKGDFLMVIWGYNRRGMDRLRCSEEEELVVFLTGEEKLRER